MGVSFCTSVRVILALCAVTSKYYGKESSASSTSIANLSDSHPTLYLLPSSPRETGMSDPPSEPSLTFACPQCRTPVRAGDILCPHCGVSLALAAVLAERQVLAAMPAETGAPYQADLILPRFGEYLVTQGHITEAQLQSALARQRQAAVPGTQKTIGQTLLEMGLVTREQLDQVSMQQVKQLQNALHDIIRQLEQHAAQRTRELEQALQQLTELNELKANFVASISHELRTPIVPIKGYTDLLTTGSLGPLSEMQTEALKVVSRSIARLEELLNALIQFASSVKGQMTITPTIFALPDLARRMVDFFGPRAAEKEVRLTIDFPASLPLVQADGEKIYWALFQLLDNALKFTPAGGVVTLSAEMRPERVRLSVRDTGPGILPERVAEIFQPFRQLDSSPGQLVDGTGLGLALVKRIVEAHASHIEVQTAPGRGSLFSFDLPIMRP
jgi:signal transduction histidine kinase